jgi:hypothetical protein
MSDSTPSPASDDPFDFEPVPFASRRHDGWTPERQRLFIAALRQIGMVSAAAKGGGDEPQVGLYFSGACEPESSFARAWRNQRLLSLNGLTLRTFSTRT